MIRNSEVNLGKHSKHMNSDEQEGHLGTLWCIEREWSWKMGNYLLRILRMLLTSISDRNYCTSVASQMPPSGKDKSKLHEKTWKQGL